MIGQLPLSTIQNNCLVFITSNFTNMYADTEESVKGFSNWNLAAKLTKVVYDYSHEYKEYKKVKNVVLKTLKGMEDQLKVKPGTCPLYFFMFDGGYEGALQITYHTICLRLKTSSTFQEDKEIQEQVDKVNQIYLNHPMGSDIQGVKACNQNLFKSYLYSAIEKDLEERYKPKSNVSLRNIQDVLERGHCFQNSMATTSNLPPADPLDNTKMINYLQEKVKEIASLSILSFSNS